MTDRVLRFALCGEAAEAERARDLLVGATSIALEGHGEVSVPEFLVRADASEEIAAARIS